MENLDDTYERQGEISSLDFGADDPAEGSFCLIFGTHFFRGCMLVFVKMGGLSSAWHFRLFEKRPPLPLAHGIML